MQIDANFQKYGSMFLIEANSLSGGTGLSVVSASSKSAVRSDIFKVEGKCTKNTALQMLSLVQNGIVSNNVYYKPPVSLAVDTNLAESIYLRLSSVASNSRGSTIVLSRDRNGTHPSGVPSANLNGDTVGTVTFAAFDQSDTVEISSFHSKSLVDSNQNMSGEVLFQVTNPSKSSRFRFNDHEKMELGHDDEFYISRPNQTLVWTVLEHNWAAS